MSENNEKNDERINETGNTGDSEVVSVQLMKRPADIKPGNIPLTCNLLEITVPELALHYYTVTIEPAISRRITYNVIGEVVSRNSHVFGDASVGYDGNTILVCNRKVSNIEEKEKVGAKEVSVRIEHKNAYTLDDITGRQCLEIMLRSHQARMYYPDGRKVVCEMDRSRIAGGIELWHGITQCVKKFNNKLFLNVDVTFTPFHEPIPLVDMLTKMCQRRDEYIDLRRVDVNKFRSLAKTLRGVRLSTMHRKNNIKFKCIDITDTPASDTYFGDDTKTSVARYFAESYSQLKHPYLPCLVVKKKTGNIFFPLEVVKIANGQKYMKKLNDQQTAEAIKTSAKPAASRFRCLEERIRSMHVTDNDVLTKLNVRISDRFLECMGKRLSVPNVKFATSSVQPSRGSWNLRNHKVVRGIALLRWVVVVLADIPAAVIGKLIPNFVRICNDMGLKVANPLKIIRMNIDKLEEVVKDHELAMVILQDRSSLVYQEVKRIADVNCCVVTQCIRRQNVEKLREGSFAANIALKINTKLGGVNFTVDNISKNDMVVFGADVTHPGFGDMSSKSIAAVVSSLDANYSKYHTSLRLQPKRQDIIEDLKDIVKKHLIRYRAVTGQVPRKIVFFRDGIGESLMQSVYFREIEAIREAFTEIKKTYKPALTFVIVQKRHSIRFKGDGANEYVRDRNAGPTCNPMPGTLVDSIGTEYNDFYMVSHFALQGTPCPIKYHILVDENSIPDFPLFIFNMCHVFTRATKSVSVVPPVYYAHLAAARAKCYVDGDRLMATQEKLRDYLYYL